MTDYLTFKLLYAKFLKARKYMAEKRLTVNDPADPRWQNLVGSYVNTIVSPMEEAWKALPTNLRKLF